jgi:PGF-pre-PGF domain-containing protein
VYASAGSFTVTLTAVNYTLGTTTVAKAEYITVANPAPVVSYTTNVSAGERPLAVQFTDTSTESPTSWYWSFGDGNTSTAKSPAFEYSIAGEYTVNHSATNAGGTGWLNESHRILVRNPAPLPGFTLSPRNWTNTTTLITFNDASIGTNVTGWQWQWLPDPGNTSTAQNPSRTFPCSGTEVCLYDTNQSAIDSSGTPWNVTAWRNVTGWVMVYSNSSPTVTFTANPLSGTLPLIVSFTATPAGSISVDSWSWDFGDGNISSLQNPTNVYSTAGQFTVTLNAINWTLGTASITKTNYISVSGPPVPVPRFSGTPTSGEAPLTVQFSDATTDPGLISWNWSFGDSSWFNTSSAAEKDPTHTYTGVGTYSVILSVTNSSGTNSTSRPNYISVTSPITPTPTQTPRNYISIGGESNSQSLECLSGAVSSGGNMGDTIPLTFHEQIECPAPAGITGITIVPAETVREFQIVVQEINLGDTLQIKDLPVAGYFRVEQNWINPIAIAQGSITFRVSSEWMNEHQVNPADIVLMGFLNAQWTELPTQQDHQSGDMYYYIATALDFHDISYYAVAVRSTEPVTPTVTRTPTVPMETEAQVTEIPTQVSQTPPKLASSGTGISPMTLGIIVLIALLVGVVLIRLWWNRRQRLVPLRD